MNKLAFAGVLACAALLWAGWANAAGQDLTGKRLLLKSKSGNEKMVLLSKDPLLNAGANGSSADPRCGSGGGAGGAVVLDDGNKTAVLSMPCAVDFIYSPPVYP